jgi:hypothetical protein
VKSKDVLVALVQAAEQAPESAVTRLAIKKARRSLAGTAPTVRDYELMLANAGRALDCIAEGFAWAAKMRENGAPYEKVALVVAEQNRRAAALLAA